MPLYYFSTEQEDRLNDRDDPIDLSDDNAAWSHAAIAFVEMLKRDRW
jgi:hypothetical protein